MKVVIETEPRVLIHPPRRLFTFAENQNPVHVSKDGKILVLDRIQKDTDVPEVEIVIVENWIEEFRDRSG